MALTGGTLSTKMIELIGDLNVADTIKNINRSIKEIERDLDKQGKKVKLNVELFGKIKDIAKDITSLQKKLDSSSSIGNIKLGVELKDTTLKSINEQIRSVQTKVDGSSVSKLKLEVDFDFQGSASKIKQEMQEISAFVDRYSKELNSKSIIDLGDDATKMSADVDRMVRTIGGLDRGTTKVGQSIEGQMRKMTDSSGKFAVTFGQDMNGAITKATASMTEADGTVKKFNYSLDENTKKLTLQSRTVKESGDQQERLASTMTKVETAQKNLNIAISKAPQGLKQELIEQAESHLKIARSMEEQGRVTDKGVEALTKLEQGIKDINAESSKLKIAEEFREVSEATNKAVREFEALGGSRADIDKFNNAMGEMTDNSVEGMKKLQAEVKEATDEIVVAGNRIDTALSGIGNADLAKAIDERDIASIKKYVEEIYDAEVATIQLTEKNDKLGNSVDRLKINMQEQNGVVKSYTADMSKGLDGTARSLTQVDSSTKTLSSNNKLLGNSFGDIVGRVTQYVGVIEVLQAGMRLIKGTVTEILAINAQMTELTRVADSSLNMDVLLGKSVTLAKELGASVEEVLGSVAEMARTFGDFNEQQLIAIAGTATMMDNVSDLNLSQSTETLVGAMNAFNISAEDSISIVDSLNEVDNQYAISTQQLSEGLSRAGATAETYGVTMQQLTGDITAIGSVTMESGSKIGNSLRTIYSRVTTMPDATALLEEFGIAIYEMGESGPEIRDVSAILGDLGDKWGELSAEQQQSIGLAVAGRSRLTQFLALMNNHQTSVEATTTAYNSQGSAMREQQAYMQSYEYQMKVAGATASELALTIEDKLVGDAMYLVISTGTEMMEVLNKIFDTFGVLPTLLGGGATAFMLLNGNIGKAVGLFKEFSTTAMSIPELLGKVGGGAGGVLKSFLSWKTAGIVAIVAGIGWALEKLISTWADNKRAMEEAELAMGNAIEAYNGYGQNIDGLIERYDELNSAYERNADSLSEDELREYLDTVNQISTILPNSVSHIDAQGQAHLKNTEMIKQEVGAMDELAKANARLVAQETEEILKEQAEAYDQAFDNITKYKNEIYQATKNLEEHSDKQSRANELQESSNAILRGLGNAYEWIAEKTGGSTNAQEKLFEAQNSSLTAQYAMKDVLQQTASTLGDQSVALLQSSGEMENMSSTAEAMVRNYSSNNSAMLENIDNQKKWEEQTEILSNKNLAFGKVVAEVYDGLANGMAKINPEKAIEGMDALVASLPTEFFTQSTDKMRSDLLALGGTVSDVMSGADLDVDLLIKSLVSAGVESSIAKSIVKDLGVTFENQSIQTAIANEELAEYNEELIKTKDSAIEAINPLEQLFGFMSEETQAMDSHIQTLQILRGQYGDTWTEMGEGQQSIEALSIAFGQSEEFVVQNLDQMAVAIRALNGATSVWSEESQTYVLEYDESVSQSTKDFLANMLAQGDGFSGFTSYFASQAGVVTETQEQLKARTEELTSRFKAFYEDPSENNHNLLLTEIQTHLNDLDGTFVTVKDSAGNLKLAMADGSNSEFLNSLNTQLGDSGLKLTETVDDITGLTSLLLTGPNGKDLKTIYSLNEQAESGDLAVGLLRESYTALMNETTSDADRETYIKILDSQMASFGENIRTTTDEQGNLKLEFANGEPSPWLEALNGMIGETGLKLEETTDKLGKVNYVLKDPNGNILFESAKTDAETLNTEVDKSKAKVDELKEKAGTPSRLSLDGTEAFGTIDGAKLKYDNFVAGLNPEGGKPKMGLDGTPAGAELDGVKLQYDNLLSKINPETGNPTINLDGSPARSEVEGVKGSINELDNNNVDLKIDPASISTFNEAVDKLKYAQEEAKTAEQRLELLKADIALTGDNLSTIMENVGTLSHASGGMQTFIDKTKTAREELGLLYKSISVEVINTSGITNSANIIADEAGRMKSAFDTIRNSISETNINLSGMSGKLNVTPLINYRTSAQINMGLVIQAFSGVAINVPILMNQVNSAMRFNTNGLADSKTIIAMHLSIITNNFKNMATSTDSALSDMRRKVTSTFLGSVTELTKLSYTMKQNVYENVSGMARQSIERFIRFVEDFIKFAKELKTATVYQATRMKEEFTTKISEMSRDSLNIFYRMANKMVESAGNLPSRIGNGIRDNMADASSAMNDLADNMVNKFKKALGIHSPSRVFYTLGGHVIDGLVNGLGDKDLKSLGQDVFSDFGGGIFDTWDMIKAYVSGDFSSLGGNIGGSVDAFAPTAMKALMMTGQFSQGNLEKLLMQMQSESGGNAKAINLWDSNAKAGIPSKGLMQVIDPTFKAYAMDGYDTNIWDPLSNILASIRYAVSRYGSLNKAYRGVGYANGGFIDEMELAWHGEEGPEAIIPLIPQRRERGLNLWAETGEKLGLDEELIKLLTASKRNTSAVSGFTSFAGLGGEAGSGGGDASATSGTVKADYSSVMRSMGIETQPMFSGMADKEALYKRDIQELNIARNNAFVTKANTELTALTAQTLKYRNALEEVNYQEKGLKDNTQKSLNTTINRQKQIEKELSKLRNTSKHTEAQRKSYNALQQEFDNNTASIYSMENEIRKLNISMNERKVEIYTDYLGQLTTGFEELRDGIAETIEDLTFSLDKLKLTDENDIGGQLKIQYNILKESMRMESTLMNNMNSLQSEYNKAVSRYGKNSEQALLAREELMAVEDSYQGSVLTRIKLEQEIEKTRENVANEGVESLKSYYKQTQTMTERAIELERKSLEKAHKDKMSLYDEEIAKIESVYDTRLKEIDDDKAESEYQQTIADLNTQRADLMSQVARASKDTTLEGKKRLTEIQAELAGVNEEISTSQQNRQEELYKQALEKQKEQQIAQITLEKEKAEEIQAVNLEALDKQIADSKKYSEDMINDEAMWADLTERFVSGDTSPLSEMMYEMQGEMAKYMSGNYKGISMGYGELSEEDKASFSEETLLEISNLMLNASESLERFTSTANERVQNINGVAGQNYNAGTMTNWNGTTLSSSGKTAPTITAPPAPAKPAPAPKKDNRYYTVKKNDTLWDLAQKYYGNPYKWTTIAQANQSPDPRKLQIGRKLLIPFKSGGFTGDWTGEAGKLAVLHKKELVLNESQTRDILNVAKIVDKITGAIPKVQINRPNINPVDRNTSGETYIIDNLTMSLEGFTGTKDDARRAFDVMAKELKKRGK